METRNFIEVDSSNFKYLFKTSRAGLEAPSPFLPLSSYISVSHSLFCTYKSLDILLLIISKITPKSLKYLNFKFNSVISAQNNPIGNQNTQNLENFITLD